MNWRKQPPDVEGWWWEGWWAPHGEDRFGAYGGWGSQIRYYPFLNGKCLMVGELRERPLIWYAGPVPAPEGPHGTDPEC